MKDINITIETPVFIIRFLKGGFPGMDRIEILSIINSSAVFGAIGTYSLLIPFNKSAPVNQPIKAEILTINTIPELIFIKLLILAFSIITKSVFYFSVMLPPYID
ncbi:MAG: hypothetical protein A2057_11890 [Ignavibacteria bacterium GWA2_35_9]|nr:MAG: hypothetical protein A2057_11890 [Ignavibacteria bacterium GWA2_35_9]